MSELNKMEMDNMELNEEVLDEVTGGDRLIHRTKAGDTLGKIAKQYGVTVAQLCKWNNIKNPDLIRQGRNLYVSAP